jgi:tetratricopeptide (TPR) repeat protein
MHAEEYERAIKAFRELISQHSDEPEIQERARVLMHASEKKLHEKSRAIFKSADDHYNMGIAELNGRKLDAAAQHLQHALKLSPKGDHILYAMAAVNALKGNRDEALSFLRQSIQHRPENRFMASRDSDFESLIDDAEFKQLVTGAEK